MRSQAQARCDHAITSYHRSFQLNKSDSKSLCIGSIIIKTYISSGENVAFIDKL